MSWLENFLERYRLPLVIGGTIATLALGGNANAGTRDPKAEAFVEEATTTCPAGTANCPSEDSAVTETDSYTDTGSTETAGGSDAPKQCGTTDPGFLAAIQGAGEGYSSNHEDYQCMEVDPVTDRAEGYTREALSGFCNLSGQGNDVMCVDTSSYIHPEDEDAGGDDAVADGDEGTGDTDGGEGEAPLDDIVIGGDEGDDEGDDDGTDDYDYSNPWSPPTDDGDAGGEGADDTDGGLEGTVKGVCGELSMPEHIATPGHYKCEDDESIDEKGYNGATIVPDMGCPENTHCINIFELLSDDDAVVDGDTGDGTDGDDLTSIPGGSLAPITSDGADPDSTPGDGSDGDDTTPPGDGTKDIGVVKFAVPPHKYKRSGASFRVQYDVLVNPEQGPESTMHTVSAVIAAHLALADGDMASTLDFSLGGGLIADHYDFSAGERGDEPTYTNTLRENYGKDVSQADAESIRFKNELVTEEVYEWQNLSRDQNGGGQFRLGVGVTAPFAGIGEDGLAAFSLEAALHYWNLGQVSGENYTQSIIKSDEWDTAADGTVISDHKTDSTFYDPTSTEAGTQPVDGVIISAQPGVTFIGDDGQRFNLHLNLAAVYGTLSGEDEWNFDPGFGLSIGGRW